MRFQTSLVYILNGLFSKCLYLLLSNIGVFLPVVVMTLKSNDAGSRGFL